MSIASLGKLNTSLVNTGFEGNFSGDAYSIAQFMTVNFDRAFYQVTDNLVDAYYDFAITAQQPGIMAIRVKLPIPASNGTGPTSVNEFYWQCTMIQTNGNSSALGFPGVGTANEILFTVVSQGGNPIVNGASYNINIHLVYRINQV